MFYCNKVFFSITLTLIGCFFLFYFGWIILLIIIIRFSTILSLNIRNRYAIRISNRFFISCGIIGIFSFLMFLLLLLLRRVANVFFLHLRIFLDPLWMPL